MTIRAGAGPVLAPWENRKKRVIRPQTVNRGAVNERATGPRRARQQRAGAGTGQSGGSSHTVPPPAMSRGNLAASGPRLTSPLVLLAALLASAIAIAQAFRALARKSASFPRRCLAQQLGHALMPVIGAAAAGKGMQPPEGEDWSVFKA